MNYLVLGLLLVIPWAATFAGSYIGAVAQLKSEGMQRGLLGFAGGVMVAASVWSLIIPAFEGLSPALGAGVATLGFVLGVLGMLALDHLVPHQHREEEAPEGPASHLSRPMLLVAAVALHNIPEGLALGVVMAAALGGSLTVPGAMAFALGLALQNLPEGMAVVVPLKQTGVDRSRCLRLGAWLSLAEPAAALVGLGISLALTTLGGAMNTLMLTFAAGAMVFIVVEELIPASQAHSNGSHAPTFGFLVGFWAMAVMGMLAG